MENNTVSLEVAKKLKKNGFVQDKSDHSWVLIKGSITGQLFSKGAMQHVEATGVECDIFAAPTAQELLDELPDYLPNSSARLTITAHAFSGQLCAMYFEEVYSLDDDDGVVECECDSSLSEALGKLWLNL